MDGLIQNLIRTALQARLDRIMSNEPLWPWTFGIVLAGFTVLLVFVLVIVLYLTLFERKLLGWIQARLGPNRVGPWGLLQPFADMIKLLIKEDIIPRDADKVMHFLAPLVIFIPTMLAFVTIPFTGGTVELPQNLVAPTFAHHWMTWIPPDKAEEYGVPGPGWLEPNIGIETNEEAHKTWWVPKDLGREPIFLPTDDEGKEILPDAVDENGVPLKVRYRIGGLTQLENKPDNPADKPVKAIYFDMVDYRTPGKQYDVLELKWEGSSGHRGIVELGIDGRQVDTVENDFAEVVGKIGKEVPYPERFDFGPKSPKIYFEELYGRFADSIAINNRKFGPDSMVPAFGYLGRNRMVWRDLYTPDWKNSAYMLGSVDSEDKKASLYFFEPEIGKSKKGETEEVVIPDSVNWTETGAAFRIQRISGGGYLIETPDGKTTEIKNVNDSASVKFGDKNLSIKLKNSQFYTVHAVGKDLGIGILYILAVTSLTVLGIFMGGFASNNKWSLVGGLRSVAQMISYEIPMTIAVMGPVIMTGSLSLVEIVETGQKTSWFILPQFLAFYVFLICMTAEVNRSPFDIPEAESELVAGFHTEYTGLKFGFFFLAEYANMFVAGAVMTTLFFGGWKGPIIPGLGEFLSGFIWFMLKTGFWLAVFIWFRGTFPRFRVDQMMDYAWKVLLPLSMLNIVMTSYATYSDWHFTIWQFNNWTFFDKYILSLVSNIYTKYFAIPIILALVLLLGSDIIGAYKDHLRDNKKKELG